MWKKLSLSLLMALLLCAASNASAQISRHAFEAVAQETLIIERTDGEILKGSLRHVDDERVIVLSEDGDIHDILLADVQRDRKSTRLNSSHVAISYSVFCLKKKRYS